MGTIRLLIGHCCVICDQTWLDISLSDNGTKNASIIFDLQLCDIKLCDIFLLSILIC